MKILALCILLVAGTAYAQMPVLPMNGTPKASCEVTVTETATLLSALAAAAGCASVGDAHAVFLQVQDNAVRIAFGGAVPTADVGYLVDDGESLYLASPGYVRTLRVINDTETAGVIYFTAEAGQ